MKSRAASFLFLTVLCAAALLPATVLRAQNLYRPPDPPSPPPSKVPPQINQPAGFGDNAPASTLSTQFEGMFQTGSIRPPDTHGIAGPNGELATVNLRIAYYDKSGTLIWGPVASSSFFAPAGNSGGGNSDPRCAYDVPTGRFYTILQENLTSNSFLNVAVSKNSNPQTSGTNDWYFYRFDMTEVVGPTRYGGDYPGLGVDDHALYATFNMYPLPLSGSPLNCQIVMMPKASINNGVSNFTQIFTANGTANGFTLQPATVLGTSRPTNVSYFADISFANNTSVHIFALTNPLTAPVLSSTIVTVPDHGGAISGAPQPGTATTVATLSPRTQGNCFYHNGAVWFCHTAGASSAKSIAFYYKVNVNGFPLGTPTLAESGGIDGGPNVWTYQPAIGANDRGDVCLVYSLSSTVNNPTMMYTARSAADSAFETPTVVKVSPGFSNSDRWGDYATVSQDPSDQSFWIAHEWARSTNAHDWSTWWARVSVLPPVTIVTNTALVTMESCLSTNGAIDPGELVTVAFSLRNTGAVNTTNLTVTLLATNGVVLPSGPVVYGTLVAGGAPVTNSFTFRADGACGDTLTAVLQLQDGSFNYGTVSFPFLLGAPSVSTTAVSQANGTLISIPSSGTATPYPSTINVSGRQGFVTKATVTLSNFTHTFPADVDVLLVSPAGQKVMLMSDAGTQTIEDFESGVWPHAPWIRFDTNATTGSLSNAFAHDGTNGLRDPEWIYRTDVQIGNPGDQISWWIRPSSSNSGRAYLGFGASSNGCWSIVAAPGGSGLITQSNGNYGFSEKATNVQTWQPNHWYKLSVQFLTTNSVVCKLYDSDGITLLNSMSQSNVTGLPGGVAMRSFGSFSLDTVTSDAAANNLTFNFDDAAPATLPSGTLASGTYLPTDYQPGETMPATAPAGPYATNLSALNGFSPNGIWQLFVSDDSTGGTGAFSNGWALNFLVAVTNPCCLDPVSADVGISLTAAPEPVLVGSNLTYTLVVSNNGPATATGVTVTNTRAGSVTYISSTPSQGSSTTNAADLVWTVGSLAPSNSATLTIVAATTAPGTVADTARVSATQLDYNSPNNTAAVASTVIYPSLSIDNVTVTETNGSTTNAVFTVSLAPAYGASVSVNFGTTNGSAVSTNDYFATNGVLTFLPGVTNQLITVVVNPDLLNEASETFQVVLSSAVSAVFTTNRGTGTILNDDPLPALTITNISITEGNVGTNNGTLNVRLGAPSGQVVTIGYGTSNGTAVAGADYIARSGLLTFNPGVTNLAITLTAIGEVLIESNETFFVNFSAATNATANTNRATATIVNDDGLPGQMHHFAFGAISSPQSAFVPFPITVTAQDGSNNTVTDFSGPAQISGVITSAVAAASIVITELEPNTPDSVEFMNAGRTSLNLTGWQIIIYDFDFYPAPTTTFSVPSGTVVPPGGIFRLVENGVAPGTYPTFNTGANINWVAGASPIAVMVRDGIGNIVDFACAASAAAASITTPTPVTTNDWIGASITATSSGVSNYQRIGNIDLNSRTNWAVQSPSAGATNTGLTVPFQGGTTPVTVSPTVTGIFTNGVWGGTVAVQQVASNMNIRAGDSGGHTNDSGLFNVVANTAVTVNDAAVFEGNAGTVTLQFTVALTATNSNSVSVVFSTLDGSANAGTDYAATNGLVVFTPGQSNKFVNVTVNGDTVSELDETFTLNLSNPTNAALARSSGTGTILNDDPLLPVSDSPRQDFPIANGSVNALLVTNGVAYLGGGFTEIGLTNSGKLVPFDLTTGQAVPGWPVVDRVVNAVIGDGAGGWYATGDFTSVGGFPKTRLVHLRADLSVDQNFQADLNAVGNALLLHGTNLFIGGSFTNVLNGGTNYARTRFAVLNPSNGVPRALPSNPGFNNSVLALATTNTTLYVGGAFTNVINGGVTNTRQRLAAIDLATGQPTAFVADTDSTVNAVALAGSTLFAGGFFATVNASTRIRLAEVDQTTGTPTAWAPTPNSTVNSLVLISNTLYAGGSFSVITNNAVPTTRQFLAALDPATGDPTAWNPTASATVSVLAQAGGQLVAGGSFTNIGGLIDVRRLAAVDLATGAASFAFDPDVSAAVTAAAVQGNIVMAGGSFSFFNGVLRSRLAAVNAATGELLAWKPDPSSTVFTLAAAGTNIYAGGLFTSIGGQTHNRIAAIDTNGNVNATFAPTFGTVVRALVAGPSNLYVGGDFTNVIITSVSTSAIAGLASINYTNGAPDTNFAPNPVPPTGATSNVFALLLNGGTLYAGGTFTNIGTQTHHRLARLNATNGAVEAAWNPQFGSNVHALALNGTNVYVGGVFTGVTNTTGAAIARNRIVSIDSVNGDATAWNPNASSQVATLVLRGTNLLAGGSFASIGGQARNRLAELRTDINTSMATIWNPNLLSDASALAITSHRVLAGGTFTSVGAQSRSDLAAFDPNFLPLLTASPGELTFVEEGPETIIVPDLVITDANDLALNSATVTIVNNFAAGQDILAALPPAGINASYVGGVLTLSGVAPLSAYQEAVRSVSFTNNSVTPSTNARTIRVTVNDGEANSLPLNFVLSVISVNEPPVISAIPSLTTVENTLSPLVSFTVGDIDNDVNTLTLSFTSSDTNLVPPGAVMFGGAGANRNLRIMPGTNLSGSALITVSVSDGVMGVLEHPPQDGPPMPHEEEEEPGASESTQLLFVVLSDFDHDGMPDVWENANGFNPLDPADSGLDADGDGMSNFQEFLAGTDPRDSRNFLQVISIAIVGNDSQISFTSVAGKLYRIERADNISGGVWATVADNVPGTGLTVNILDPGSAILPGRNYRVRLLP